MILNTSTTFLKNLAINNSGSTNSGNDLCGCCVKTILCFNILLSRTNYLVHSILQKKDRYL